VGDGTEQNVSDLANTKTTPKQMYFNLRVLEIIPNSNDFVKLSIQKIDYDSGMRGKSSVGATYSYIIVMATE